MNIYVVFTHPSKKQKGFKNEKADPDSWLVHLGYGSYGMCGNDERDRPIQRQAGLFFIRGRKIWIR